MSAAFVCENCNTPMKKETESRKNRQDRTRRVCDKCGAKTIWVSGYSCSTFPCADDELEEKT